ncbi:hypothetical protein EDB83DRAFT_2317231 [Lactarius deliciosus]|nr:hypothetical protein EDB83DRAFT_2317231 [Lactarius deliciosus]
MHTCKRARYSAHVLWSIGGKFQGKYDQSIHTVPYRTTLKFGNVPHVYEPLPLEDHRVFPNPFHLCKVPIYGVVPGSVRVAKQPGPPSREPIRASGREIEARRRGKRGLYRGTPPAPASMDKGVRTSAPGAQAQTCSLSGTLICKSGSWSKAFETGSIFTDALRAQNQAAVPHPASKRTTVVQKRTEAIHAVLRYGAACAAAIPQLEKGLNTPRTLSSNVFRVLLVQRAFSEYTAAQLAQLALFYRGCGTRVGDGNVELPEARERENFSLKTAPGRVVYSSERATIASSAPARTYCSKISCQIPHDAPVDGGIDVGAGGAANSTSREVPSTVTKANKVNTASHVQGTKFGSSITID